MSILLQDLGSKGLLGPSEVRGSHTMLINNSIMIFKANMSNADMTVNVQVPIAVFTFLLHLIVVCASF